ncbi:MAG: hypothetical protein EPO64_10830 [Nitrospirae bacterium]|nr:MAG: hypothetical protein EPO64_10830 [Nitrospirota bacterium]
MHRLLHNRLCRLLCLFHRPVHPSDSVYPLLSKPPLHIDFDGFQKGIDNVHLDVRLSPQFLGRVKQVTTAMLEQEIGLGRWGEKSSGPTRQDWEDFRTSYAGMVEAAIHRAKLDGGLALVQLVQVAAVRFIGQYVQGELEQLRQGLRAAMSSGGSLSDSDRLELTERLSWLTRNRARLRYKLNRQLITQLGKAEEGAVGELRHSLLGERYSLPEEVLLNPLLQAEALLDDEIMMKQYVVLGQDGDDRYSFAAIDDALPYVFRRPKPVAETEVALAGAEAIHRQLAAEFDRLQNKRKRTRDGSAGTEPDSRKAGLGARVEQTCAELERLRAAYLKESYGWADVPANVDVLFNATLYRERLDHAKKEKDREAVADLTTQIRFQRRLVALVERHFRATGLLAEVVAGYETVSLYRGYASVLTAQQLRRFLSGSSKRKELLRMVKDKQHASGKTFPLEPLTEAARRVDQLSCRQQREYLVRFLKDFVTFRRDLANYHLVQNAMGRIQLQEDPKNIRLSRANHTLYEFLAANEKGAVAQTILGHVILKADVRGSTTMVAELQTRGLNPASHFSLNFFDPLNELLETYGAGKVFIEGDAVILSILEYEEVLEHQFSVARACGLAKRLLGMVQAQNEVCRKDGLPELELGIGLVFSEEQPAFLYDGNNRIMISPAIGKADRLSSCSWMLRKQRSQSTTPAYTSVDIYEIPEGDPLRGEKGEVHLRYNLNGIELDEAGFAKLKTEISLQPIEVVVPGDEAPTTLYAGRYPDLKGAMQQVVVREGTMRLLDKQHPRLGQPTAGRFYEVVTNEFLLGQVEAVVKTGEGGLG